MKGRGIQGQLYPRKGWTNQGGGKLGGELLANKEREKRQRTKAGNAVEEATD